MIRDTLEDLGQATHDVCIIGAGTVGLPLALELERHGCRVLMLESGGEGEEPETQALSDAEIADPARHDSMRIAVARRLGGTSNLWGGRCLPFDPIDFEPREIVGGALWPFGHDTLAPYLDRAVGYARAGKPVFSDPTFHEPGGDFTLSSLERWSSSRRLQVAHRAALTASRQIDIRLHATVAGLDWQDDRVAAVRVAGRDGTMVRVPVRDVVMATGGLESTRLLLADQRQNPARYGGVDGPLGRTYMGHVIGEIADIVFKDAASERAFDYRIDAHGSYVRQRFVPSAEAQRRHGLLNSALWPVVPRIADAAHRSGFLSAVALGLSIEPLGRRILAEALRKRHIPDGMARLPHLRNILTDLPRTAVAVPQLLWNRFGAKVPVPAFFQRNPGRRYGLAYHSEQVPSALSRVRLTDQMDRTGLPRLEIDLRFSATDADSVVRTHDLLADWLRAHNLGELVWRHPAGTREQAVLDQASHGTHQIGTARLSARDGKGAVDPDLRAFGSQNLYVASSAVLPTSGQANPTLTVIALAMRLADRLAARRPAAAVESTVLQPLAEA